MSGLLRGTLGTLGGERVVKFAAVSRCGKYRYWLRRDLHLPAEGGRPARSPAGLAVFLLANPSTADAEADDATVRKCWGYARRWGHESLVVVNTNPFRSTDPKACASPPERVMRANDGWIFRESARADVFVGAWGRVADPALARRAVGAMKTGVPLCALLVGSQDGPPCHPLYLPGDLVPRRLLELRRG